MTKVNLSQYYKENATENSVGYRTFCLNYKKGEPLELALKRKSDREENTNDSNNDTIDVVNAENIEDTELNDVIDKDIEETDEDFEINGESVQKPYGA